MGHEIRCTTRREKGKEEGEKLGRGEEEEV
jgi:hypothetical protein